MATDVSSRVRRFGLPAGLVSLAFLAYQLCREAVVLIHETGRLHGVGVATICDRASQLKPSAWKAPFAEWAFWAYIVVCVATIVVLLVAGLSRLRSD